MSEEPDNLILKHLRELRAEMNARFEAIEKRIGKIEYNTSLLADGMLSLRRDVQTLLLCAP